MTHTGQRPQGVFIHHRDGTTTPVELAYVGLVDGQHEWASMTSVGEGENVTIAVLPAKASIIFPAPEEELR